MGKYADCEYRYEKRTRPCPYENCREERVGVVAVDPAGDVNERLSTWSATCGGHSGVYSPFARMGSFQEETR